MLEAMKFQNRVHEGAATMSKTTRVLLYSHDSQGLGHARRNLAIAHALAKHLPEATGTEVAGLIVSGLPRSSEFPLPPGFDWITIPGISKGSSGYQPRSLSGDFTSVVKLRSSLLEAALLGFEPDLVIVDRHILGVAEELRGPLMQLRKHHPSTRIVLGLREILDEPEAAAKEWTKLGDPERLLEFIDEVWVYGDPEVHNPFATGEIPVALAGRARFTGFLAKDRPAAHEDGELCNGPFVLTTVGGGSDGGDILRAAVGMTPPQGHEHIVITGPQLSDDEFDAVRALAPEGTHVLRSWPGLAQQIGNAAAVISMAGYNTTCEILATQTPALLIPREVPRQEQLIRARALGRIDAVDHLRWNDVTAEALSEWAATAVTGRVDRDRVDIDGLATVPRFAADILASMEDLFAALDASDLVDDLVGVA